ncbi:MAG TPA: DUF5615 family PIN-like protein [Vicinamibacteria bacterium]|nr:DUF5615 family PIN-like protein [Vicinamibacteria bacterium]
MARGFAVFTDNHVQQAVVDGLVAAGWDVVRAIDAFAGGTADAVLFEHAARDGRVFVTNDEDLLVIAAAWLDAGRSFPGLVYWHEDDYAAMTTGEILGSFEALSRKLPFPYPIHFVKPRGTRGERRERFKRSRRRRGRR